MHTAYYWKICFTVMDKEVNRQRKDKERQWIKRWMDKEDKERQWIQR